MRNDDEQKRRQDFGDREFTRRGAERYARDSESREFQGGGYPERAPYRSESSLFEGGQERRNQFERSNYGRSDEEQSTGSRGAYDGGPRSWQGRDREFGETQSAGMSGGSERYERDHRYNRGGGGGRETGYGGYGGEYGGYAGSGSSRSEQYGGYGGSSSGRSEQYGGSGSSRGEQYGGYGGGRGEQYGMGGGYNDEYGSGRGGMYGQGGGQRGQTSGMSRGSDYPNRQWGSGFGGGGENASNWEPGSYPGYDRYGGQGSGQRSRTSPKGYQRSDERIREDVCEQLSRSGLDVSEVSVNVSNGHVTLEGTVDDRHSKFAIENCVDDCMGVEDIDNRIRVQRNAAGSSSWGSGASSSGRSDSSSSGSVGSGSGMSGSGTSGSSGTSSPESSSSDKGKSSSSKTR